ncbi:MAG: tetratricopeptide repeat protein [Planctomycetaceae bacterium]|nr:tetratricopeptide repeat protein [Planctomycetaceae bacterium]
MMKHTGFAVLVLLVFTLGCQSTHSPHWLSASKNNEHYLGQAVPDDPFFQALHATQAPSQSGFANPFAPNAPTSETANQTMTDAERERIQRLATATRDNMPDYLKPLNPWEGPFVNRNRGRDLEQDIIRQVGYDHVAARLQSDTSDYDWDWGKEVPQKGFDWSALDPGNLVSRMRERIGMGPDENKANESMQKGREILLSNPDLRDQKKNIEAAKHFIEAAKRFPDSVLEEDALHLAAECYFFADDYPSAFSAYQRLVIKYQHSKHVDNAVRRLFKIGQYWEGEAERSRTFFSFWNRSLPNYDTFGFAKKAYETIFIHDPMGPVSDDALMALATAYLKRGRHQGDDHFNQAAFYYQRLREDHPSSPHLAKAYENELFARTRAYLGPEHPSNTLAEARKLAEIMTWQFREELDSEDKEAVLGLKESILNKEAEQIWATGQFWDIKKRHYDAARLSYNRLVAEYPQTEFAERARQRLIQIEHLGDKPSIFALPVNPLRRE